LTSLCKRTLQYPDWLKLIEKSLGTKLSQRKAVEKLRTTLGQKVNSPSISVSFGSIKIVETEFLLVKAQRPKAWFGGTNHIPVNSAQKQVQLEVLWGLSN